MLNKLNNMIHHKKIICKATIKKQQSITNFVNKQINLYHTKIFHHNETIKWWTMKHWWQHITYKKYKSNKTFTYLSKWRCKYVSKLHLFVLYNAFFRLKKWWPFNINGIMIHLGLAIQLNKNINQFETLMMKHVIY
jgi:hypothetical protein